MLASVVACVRYMGAISDVCCLCNVIMGMYRYTYSVIIGSIRALGDKELRYCGTCLNMVGSAALVGMSCFYCLR